MTETEPNLKPALEELKDSADMLSQFTKRVKKQMKAANSGKTINAAPMPNLKLNSKRVAGLADNKNREQDVGIGMPGQTANLPPPTVAIGQSSLAEYIPGVEVGAFTALNTDQFTYYAFYARMNEQVRNRWVSMMRNYMSSISNEQMKFLSLQERQCNIEIILTADGRFDSAVLHNSSGDKNLDRFPVNSFEAAAPFLNPPRGMVEADGLIHLKYAFVMQFRPPTFGPASN